MTKLKNKTIVPIILFYHLDSSWPWGIGNRDPAESDFTIM